MGQPKFPRRKFTSPSHPWRSERIKLEKEITRKYGLKNKREIWKASSFLRNIRGHSRELRAKLRYEDKQATKEANEMIARYTRLGFVPEGATLDNLLQVSVEDFLTRRLQTQVYLKGLAHTPDQARQFIIHGHIFIQGRKMTIPGYLVKKSEEESIVYNPDSGLTNPDHPMRPPEGFQPKFEPIKIENERDKGPARRGGGGSGGPRGRPGAPPRSSATAATTTATPEVKS